MDKKLKSDLKLYWETLHRAELVWETGFELTYLKGCLYLPLHRLYNKLTVAKKPDIAAPFRKKDRRGLKELLTLVSFPIEVLSNILPDRFATH
jgi:hypothetical protein